MEHSLPFDVYDMICQSLALERDTETLSSLSRARSFLTALCQRYIFEEVRLSDLEPKDFEETGMVARLEHTLSQSPHLASYIKVFRLDIDDPEQPPKPSVVPSLLQRLKNVRKLSIRTEYIGQGEGAFKVPDWQQSTPSLTMALQSLIQSETLVVLDLQGFKNIPLRALLSPCRSLRIVCLCFVEDLTPDPTEEDTLDHHTARPLLIESFETGRSFIPSLVGPMPTPPGRSPPLFDFSNLTFLSFSVRKYTRDRDLSIGHHVFDAAVRLESLRVFEVNTSLKGLIQPHHASSLTKIRSLQVFVDMHEDEGHVDPFRGMLDEVAKVPKNNSLENVEIVTCAFNTPICDSDEYWVRVGEVLSKDSSPGLRYIKIRVIYDETDDDPDRDAEWEARTQRWFSNLRKGVEVDFAVSLEDLSGWTLA